MLKFFLTAAIIPQLIGNINAITIETATDPSLIEAYNKASDRGFENGAEMRELFLKSPLSEDELSSLLALQSEDGSFSDIDYQDKHRGAWPVSQHCFRVQRLAINWAQTGNDKALECCRKAMHFWSETMPVCPNWWHNQIGVPRLMGPAFLLLKDVMTQEELAGAVRVMDKSGLRQTGQNKVWQAGNVAIKAMLLNDEALLVQARDSIASELHISNTVEGLQPDYSFHQHGSQLQFGNYGLAYAVSLSWWARALDGTELAFSAEQIDALKKYVELGLTQVIWKGWFDHSACGRQVFLNAQKGKAICALMAAENLGIKPSEYVGGIYYPYSDFGIYRSSNWYASIRMQSTRVKGFETTNHENMKAWFSADGALLVRVNGDEYNNLSGAWNWKHIPGATTYDDGTPIELKPEGRPDGNRVRFNMSDKVYGFEVKGLFGKLRKAVSDRLIVKRMATSMELNRDGLSAHKSWFFWKRGIVCLGAGISFDTTSVSVPGQASATEGVSGQDSATAGVSEQASGFEVLTTLNQCHLRGEVLKGDNWVWHDGILYVILDKKQYILANGPHSGSWRPVSPTYSDEVVTEDLFDMYISHGSKPVDDSYAYVIVPDLKLNSGKTEEVQSEAEQIAKRISRRIKIVENSADRQVVRIGLRRYIINWKTMM